MAYCKKQIWEETYRGIYPDTKIDQYQMEEQMAKRRAYLKQEEVFLYGVFEWQELIAYVSYGKARVPFDHDEYEIGLLNIRKAYRKQGLGKRLFLFACERLWQKTDHFFVSCNRYNENARKFYEHVGGVCMQVDEWQQDRSKVQVKYHFEKNAVSKIECTPLTFK